jgi:hypothetical protein
MANNTARHRVNVAARYRFSAGLLRGLGLNAGVNYRGYVKSGSRDTRLKFGLADNVTPTSLQNAIAAFDYLWSPPTYLVSAGANYTRRFGKYNTRFQINVSNVLDDDQPIWGRSGPVGNDGSGAGLITTNQFFAGNPRMQVYSSFTQNEPRKISFTTTVSF